VTGLQKAQAHHRADSDAKRAKVLQAIRLAVARGEIPTPSSIARAAGVDRSIFYGQRGRPLRAELDLAVAKLQADFTGAITTAIRITAATLRADLATANELNRRQRSQIAVLEATLGRHLGEQILADLPTTDRITIAADQQLEAKIDELTLLTNEQKAEIHRLNEDLEGARDANRQLTRRINGRTGDPR
jgi:hypothetical protein